MVRLNSVVEGDCGDDDDDDDELLYLGIGVGDIRGIFI